MNIVYRISLDRQSLTIVIHDKTVGPAYKAN